MDRNRRQQVLIAILLLMAAVVAIWLRGGPKDAEPAGSDYYTGPRESKTHPGVWVTADGRIVPPPADAKPMAVGDNADRKRLGGE
jgi:hypothetical protein